jgi:hypothetical protein
MLSMDSADDELRSAAYDLLGSVCSYLQFDKSPVIAAKGMQQQPVLTLLNSSQLVLFWVILALS